MVRTPLWSFQATGRTVITVLAVLVLIGSVVVHHYVEAAAMERKQEMDTAYQIAVIKRLDAVTWVLIQDESTKKALAKKLDVPETLRNPHKDVP